MMETLIRLLAALVLIPCFYGAYLITMTAEGQVPPPNQTPACTALPVVIDSHRCLHVVKGTPHFDPGTPVEVIVEEDRR